MANTTIGFSINIKGIDNIDQLNQEIKETNKALKGLTVGTKEYAETSEKLAKLKAEQKALRKEQTELTKSFLEQSKALGAYDKASAKLNRLRKEFKNLAISGKGASKEAQDLKEEIQRLDKVLKKTDASVGQFQRSVGNYPRIFGLSTKALGNFIPGLDQLSERLDKATGGSNILGKALIGGFVAFKAGQFLVDVFKQFDELIKKIDETRNSVAAFAAVGGEDLDSLTASVTALSQTFDVDAEQINKSAQALSKQLGISFEDALGKIENGLKAGQASNAEYLSSIEELPEAFQDAGEAAGDYADRTGKILDANKELAAAQIDLVNEFSNSASGIKTFATQAQAFLIRTLLAIIELFRPVVESFQEVGRAIGDLLKSFPIFNKEAGAAKTAINLLLIPIKNAATFLKFVADRLVSLIDGFKALVDNSPFLQKFFKAVIDGFKTIQQTINDLPFIFAGIIESLKQLGRNFVTFFETTALDAQIFAAKVKGIFGAAVKDQIEELRKRRKEVQANAISLGDAFSKGFNDAKAKADAAAAKRELERAKAQESANNAAIQKQRAEQAAQARQKRVAEQRKLQEQLQKERQKFLENETKFLEQQTAILGKLQERAEKLIIDGIADAQLKARTLAKKASEERIEQAQKEFNTLEELGTKRIEDAVRLFGETSKEARTAQEQAAAEQLAAQSELDEIRVRERIALTNELLAIDEDFTQKQLELQQKQFTESVALATEAANLRQLKLDEQLAKGLITEEQYSQEAYNIQKDRIARELELLEARQKQLELSGVAANDAENRAILTSKQSLYTELAQLDKQFTEGQEARSNERANTIEAENQKALESFQTQFKQVTSGFSQGLQLLSDLSNAEDEKRKARLDKQLEDNQAATEALQERLANSSGLEAQFLQQQIDANLGAAEQIARNKERIEKEQAKRAKQRAIIESIIQTALAVVESLPNIPLSILAGIQGGIATATIAAQPLAKGGLVGSPQGEIVHFANGGKVTNKGNIKPLSNGDNVLATLKTGEVVLNKGQQRAIGGMPVLRAAGVPGFADGGLVGAPTSLVQSATSSVADSKATLERLESMIAATNNRVDRIQVNWTANSQEQADKGLNDKNSIQVNATF